jgi:hypothetical protein
MRRREVRLLDGSADVGRLLVRFEAIDHIALDIEQHEAAAEFMACVGEQASDAFRHTAVIELVLHLVRLLAGERPETELAVLETAAVPGLVVEPVRKILRQVRRRDGEELSDFWFGHWVSSMWLTLRSPSRRSAGWVH